MIAIIDYGVGNLYSLASSLKHLGLEYEVTSNKAVIENASHIILPGVGAFGDAAQKLEDTGLWDFLKGQAENGKPFLGICLGMQLLFDKSYEYGEHEGLGLIKGCVKPLRPALADQSLKVPHIGWNSLKIIVDNPLFRYFENGQHVYYVHSFYAADCKESTLAVSDYSIPVTGVVNCGNVWGCQFHPEKSGDAGLNLLRAFAEL